MPISVQITCETADEYREAMVVLAGLVSAPKPPRAAANQPPPFVWRVRDLADDLPDDRTQATEAAEARGAPEPSAAEDITHAINGAVTEAEAEADTKPKRRRRTRAQMEAEAARGHAAAPEDPSGRIEDPRQGELPEAEPPASPDPAKDKAEALDLLRALYEQDGLAIHVESLLAQYGVSKFTHIPVEQGPALLAEAKALELAGSAPG